MSKLTLKKLSAILLSATGFSALAAGAAGCVPKSTDLKEPDNVEITRLTPPTDGSLPTAHTCAENLAYVAAVFDSQTQYHSYSYGVTSASIATQTTRNFRDFKDGVLITTDLTHSSMVKSGTQTCTVTNSEGVPEVYFRTSGAPEADTLPAQASWSEEAPTLFTERSYHYTYGLLPTELFNYIVNEQNIVDSEEVKVNADGTYTQSFTLDPKASTYYYQFGMKTRGGLSGYPEFESITFSVTFDGGWRILSADMHEVSKVNKGIVVTSVSDFSTEYYYGDDHFDYDHFDYYESYYKKYLGAQDLEQGGASDEKLTVDVTNVLSNGFSGIMNGGDQYEISLNLGKNRYVGYVYLSLDLADPLGTLALKASLGKSLKEQTLYIEYGNGEMSAYYGRDFALGANLAEVKIAVEQLGGVIDNIAQAFAKGEAGGQSAESAPADGAEAGATQSDPLSELMNAMVLTSDEREAVLTLNTDDLLGMGIGINARLAFGINNNKITFRGGTVSDLSIGGEKLDLGLSILTTTAPEIGRQPSETGANLADYVADISSLLGADLLKVTASIHGDDEAVKIGALKGLTADVTAYADIDGVSVGAEADVSYTYKGSRISAKAGVWYGYDPQKEGYGQAVVTLDEFNGAPVNLKLKCDIKEVAEAVSTLVTFAGGDGGAATDGLVGILNGALSSDLSSLLTELYADKTQIKAGVSVDALLKMLNVNAGVKFGSCALTYERGESVYGGSLSASLPALGFNLGVCGADGEVTQPDLDDCLDLVYVIEDIKEIANADLLKVSLSLDGSAEGVTLSALNGVKLDIAAYVDINNTAVAAEVGLSYTLGEDTVSAKLTAYFGGERAEDGAPVKSDRLILSLDEINGAPVYASVGCSVSELTEAVTALLSYANVKTTPFDGATPDVSKIITDILGADFAELVPVLSNDADGLKVGLNVDKALSVFGVNAGMSFGNVNLVYSHSDENKLVANVPALGIGAAVCGSEGKFEVPEKDFLDLTDLVKTVQAAWEQVDGIIKEEGVAFEIVKGETNLSLDGIIVEIWGEGEVSWKKGSEYVALDLSMAITEKATDVATLKLIYDKNAVDGPLVKLALNDVGIEIYKEDIDGVTDSFKGIYDKISALIGGGSATDTAAISDDSQNLPADGVTGETGEPVGTPAQKLNYDKLISLIFGVLSSDSWVDKLNDFTLTSDGKSVTLSYLEENSADITVGADGALTLYYDGAFGERFSLGGGLVVTSNSDSLRSSLNGKFASLGKNMSSTKTEGSAPFVKLAYDYLFSAIDAIDVKNILGSDTYTVKFMLDGKNCNVPELADVFINAEIYVTDGVEDDDGVKGKLAEGLLNIDVAGVTVNLHVVTERRNEDTRFFINLSQVADIKLPDLKFLATQKSLYETFEVLVSTLNNTRILDSLGKLMGGDNGGSEAQPDNGANVTNGVNGAAGDKTEGKPLFTQAQIDGLADLLSRILNFNFSEAVVATEADGVTTATIDLDNLLKQLGVNCGSLGTLKAEINHNNHSMTTVGKALVTDVKGNEELKDWISLSSELAARRDYVSKNSEYRLERSEYISIEFLPTLIEDLVKVATDENGELRTQFTLSGNITANIVSMLDVNIDTITVTAGIDAAKGLTLNAVMHVQKTKVLGMGISEGTVGLTYSNGLLTLARGLNTTAPEYKVMTFDYFMDNMLSKNSVLEWWLQISGWDLIMSFVNVDVDVSSGLTTPKDVYLYDVNEKKADTEISMYSFVDALRVVINGEQSAVFGNYPALESDLGINDNYYGFALNAGAVTGGVLTKLNAAITRNDGVGLDTVKASGAIQSYISFGANLKFNCDWSEEYAAGTNTALTSGKTAPDLYSKAMAEAEKADKLPDFGYNVKNPSAGYDEVFGCFSVTNGSNGYSFATESSHMLYSHVLTVIGLNGEIETRDVRHGSTVYLYDNAHPAFCDGQKEFRLLYSLTENEVGATSVVMNGDLTVYAVRRKAATVIFHSNEQTIEVSSFVGDKVPSSVAGLETIGTPAYADGTPVGENDTITAENTVIDVYGTFVNSEITVNYVNYRFNAETMSYTATGRAAGFNDYYSTKGNTLVLENEIGGYPVTAIAANAFAIADGKAIVSVVVPENIVTVGENAFANNVDMKSAVFLAENVTFLGKDGSNKTMPFYGCSVSSNEEKTALEIYYNNITASGGNWRHFRYVSKVFSFNFYIGDSSDGGALYSKGQWQYVDYNVNVDLNGVLGGTLTKEAVKKVIGGYFPYVTAGSYSGSAYEAAVISALDAGLADMGFTRGGITYMCDYTVSTVTANGKTTVMFNVTYKKTAEIYVSSPLAFSLYGTAIAANTQTAISVPVDGDVINLPVPVHTTHKFVEWKSELKDGKLYYTASWEEKTKYALTVKINKGLTDNNNIYVNGANQGQNATPKIYIYEGSVNVSVDSNANRIYITDCANTYYIEVKELVLKWFKYEESGKLRSVTTSDIGDKSVNGDMTITVSY